ncbi:unnamed protein product, partial [Aphanomyces euteiches]
MLSTTRLLRALSCAALLAALGSASDPAVVQKPTATTTAVCLPLAQGSSSFYPVVIDSNGDVASVSETVLPDMATCTATDWSNAEVAVSCGCDMLEKTGGSSNGYGAGATHWCNAGKDHFGVEPPNPNCISPTPAPTPQATPEPTPASTPSPTPQPTPASTPSPTPEPTPASTPSPTPEPTPASTPSPTPGPTPESTPSPTPEPTPASTPSPTPEPTPESTPSPTPEPTPASTPSPTPEPTPASTPSPTPEPTP